MTQTLQTLSPLSHWITPARLSVPNSKFLSCPQKYLRATSDVCTATQRKFAASRTKGAVPLQRESSEEQNNSKAQFMSLCESFSRDSTQSWCESSGMGYLEAGGSNHQVEQEQGCTVVPCDQANSIHPQRGSGLAGKAALSLPNCSSNNFSSEKETREMGILLSSPAVPPHTSCLTSAPSELTFPALRKIPSDQLTLPVPSACQSPDPLPQPPHTRAACLGAPQAMAQGKGHFSGSKSHGKKPNLLARLICTYMQFLLSNANPPEGHLRQAQAAGAPDPCGSCLRRTWLGRQVCPSPDTNTCTEKHHGPIGLRVKTCRMVRGRTWSTYRQDMSHENKLPSRSRQNRAKKQGTLNGPHPGK